MTGSESEIDDVLVDRLAQLGAAGSLGGGGAGAAWTARRLATETAAGTHRFDPVRADEVLAALRAELGDEAEVDDDPTGPTLLRGVVGSGFGGMNPTYVLVVVDAARGEVGVAAHAKEGLIKQRSAAKAVDRVLAALG